jgi:glycosyltransferase involved in cell wall biosynthesis
VKLAVVVQRYGADIGGGSELHARYIAELLSEDADVRVLTTCARDYITWRNDYPPGEDRVNGIPVERFPVARERDARDFARRSALVFEARHSVHDEWAWLDAQGPVCPTLIERIERPSHAFDFVIAFSVRYYTALRAAWTVGERAIVVPTMERDPAMGLTIVRRALRRAGAIMYNSPEERRLLQAVAGLESTPSVTVGVGSRVPDDVQPGTARAAFGLTRPYVVYVGRIDANKGCDQLFDYFLRYCHNSGNHLDLVLIGSAVMPVPDHPRVRHLGYVSDAQKFGVLAGAVALVMPSPFESLSMVALEAWGVGRPVLASARCDVLVGQCLRSGGGLYYQNGREFEAMLDTLLADPALADAMGARGRAYYRAEYSWPVIRRKYLDVLAALQRRPSRSPHVERREGWLARRRRTVKPAAAVVASAPVGPVRDLSACAWSVPTLENERPTT